MKRLHFFWLNENWPKSKRQANIINDSHREISQPKFNYYFVHNQKPFIYGQQELYSNHVNPK